MTRTLPATEKKARPVACASASVASAYACSIPSSIDRHLDRLGQLPPLRDLFGDERAELRGLATGSIPSRLSLAASSWGRTASLIAAAKRSMVPAAGAINPIHSTPPLRPKLTMRCIGFGRGLPLRRAPHARVDQCGNRLSGCAIYGF